MFPAVAAAHQHNCDLRLAQLGPPSNTWSSRRALPIGIPYTSTAPHIPRHWIQRSKRVNRNWEEHDDQSPCKEGGATPKLPGTFTHVKHMLCLLRVLSRGTHRHRWLAIVTQLLCTTGSVTAVPQVRFFTSASCALQVEHLRLFPVSSSQST